MTVLDALYQILDHQDATITFRSSCRSSVCGTCAMFINGHQRLACNTQISTLGKHVTIEPLPHLPVIRDLVVDLDQYFRKLAIVKPYFEGPKTSPTKEFIQSPKDRKAIDGAIECVDCGACYSACSDAFTDPDYPGPAAFVKAYRFIADTRDIDSIERLRLIWSEVLKCPESCNADDVCPKSIGIIDFIQALKRKATLTPKR
jgi:succinate dehydrogenase / fumarate reductase iron-sulfur subunit